ncbi:MAG TPA: 16S rRNA (guanine(966)-N(2))-methyltransferase RsmD [Desulfuromonadaceae bacterium]
MRVIAGKARGTRLAAPPGMRTRPTADRVREALFSIIQSRFTLEGARVLDICAGTGSMGIEALSREAESCAFIEHDRNVAAVLKRNLTATHFSEQSQVLEMDVHKALRHLAGRKASYDLVFFDPPYASGLYATVPEALCSLSLLADGGVLVAEGAARNTLPEHLGPLAKYERRVYGDTALEFYLLEGE